METEFTRRARYHSSADGFNIARPAVTHNTGAARAPFLIVQDGGLHYHTRTMGFGFDTV